MSRKSNRTATTRTINYVPSNSDDDSNEVNVLLPLKSERIRTTSVPDAEWAEHLAVRALHCPARAMVKPGAT